MKLYGYNMDMYFYRRVNCTGPAEERGGSYTVLQNFLF